MRRVTIKGDRTAGYETCIDGVDVSPLLNGLRFSVGDGHQPELIVSTNAGRVDIEADATVVVEDPGAELNAILRFLEEVDAVALEEAMASGGMDQGPAQVALRVLKSWAMQSYSVAPSGNGEMVDITSPGD